MRVAVVYDSGYGHTGKQAEAVASGAARVEGVTVTLIALADGEPEWAAIEAADAVIFGSPTYNGTISARFKAFMEASTRHAWVPQKWRNKIAAGFTNSGSWHGDKLNSLVTLALFAAQHGMIWTGLDLFPGHSDEANNRIGGWLGAMAYSKDEPPELSPIKSDLDTAAYLGERVAAVALQFARGADYGRHQCWRAPSATAWTRHCAVPPSRRCMEPDSLVYLSRARATGGLPKATI